MIQDARNQVLNKSLDDLIAKMGTMSEQYHDVSMLSFFILFKVGRMDNQPVQLQLEKRSQISLIESTSSYFIILR